VVLALMLSMAAPALRGWGRGTKLRDSSDQLLAATRFARSAAISTATPHQLEIDPAGNAYTVTTLDAGVPVPAAGEFGRTITLPQGVRIELDRQDGGGGAIEFYPSGRATPARLRLVADWGETWQLEAQSAAEPFRLASAR